jgi:hypothetical protein
LVAYQAEEGHCDVPKTYRTKDGFSLGNWVNNQRAAKNPQNSRSKLSAERIQRLEAEGFVWDLRKALPK